MADTNNVTNLATPMIKGFEGLSLEAYKDAHGWSIGYGHFTLQKPSPPRILEEEADRLLNNDVRNFTNSVIGAVTNSTLSDQQLAALVSLTYNIGIDAFLSSTLLKKVNANDIKGASAEFLKWNKSQGKVLTVLTERRATERASFDTSAPPYDASKGTGVSNVPASSVSPGSTQSQSIKVQGVSFNFKEEQHGVLYHNIRIYIAGADVTPWLTGSVSIKKADRDGIGSASFTLANTYRAFEITEENINTKLKTPRFRLTDPYGPDGAYSELAKHVIHKNKTESSQNVKHEVSSIPRNVPQNQTMTDSTSQSYILQDDRKTIDSKQMVSSTVDKYNFNIGSLVFHKYDPIRIFVANPFSQTDDQWVCEFTGVVDTKPYSQNYVNGESIVNITCQDIRILMQSMRTQINPFASVSNENSLFFSKNVAKNNVNAGFWNDLVVTKGSSDKSLAHVLGGLTWFDSIKFLLLGQYDGKTYGKVGDLSLGEVRTYSASWKKDQRIAKLQDWNNLVIFGKSRKWLSKSVMREIGENTFPGKIWAPEKAYIHFLTPDSGLPVGNTIATSVAGGMVAQVDWVSRLELVARLCKDIDYQFHITGIGDLVFEFPFYDFMPSDFGATYNSLYTFKYQMTNDNINDEGGTPISALQITSTPLSEELSQNHPNDANFSGPQPASTWKKIIFSNVLASRIGPHIETYHVPGIASPTSDPATQDKLATLGLIEFNKRLAQFNTFDITAAYRALIGVNRPIYHAIKERMGISTTVSETWNIRQDATLNVDLSYTRKRELDGAWRFITGGEAAPISYSYLFEDSYMINNQGVGVATKS